MKQNFFKSIFRFLNTRIYIKLWRASMNKRGKKTTFGKNNGKGLEGNHSFFLIYLLGIALFIINLNIFSNSKRRLKVDDLFKIEQLHNIAISPDFSCIAVVIKRAKTKSETYKKDYLEGNDRADIWLLSTHGGEPKILTDGFKDGSGYWNPVWSPDGKRIALLSTKGGGNVRLYVYEKNTNQLKRMSDLGVDLECWTNGEENRYLEGDYFLEWFHNPYIWISDTKLICPVLPRGEQSIWYKSEIETPRIAMEEWPKAQRGTTPTVSVIESGNKEIWLERPKGKLLLIDVAEEKISEIAQENFRHMIISPNKKYVGLILDKGVNPPKPDKLLQRGGLRHSKFGILSLENLANIEWFDEPIDPRIGFMEIAHAWAPDSSSIAIIAKEDDDNVVAETLFLIFPEKNKVQKITGDDIKVSSLFWQSPMKLLVYAASGQKENGENGSRLDWLVFNPLKPTEYKNITMEMESVPSRLVHSRSSKLLFGAVAGDFWSIDIENCGIQNLTKSFEPKIESIIWPKSKHINPIQTDEFIVQASSEQKKNFYRIDTSNIPLSIIPFPKPSQGALLVNFVHEENLTIFAAEESNGTFLWTGDGKSDQFKKQIELNEHLNQIADSKHMIIEYQGIEGDELKAHLLLPIEYESGKKYPLITVVYAGAVYDDWTFALNKNNLSFLNYNLLSSHGFAVLFPSMPLPAEIPIDPYIEIPKGVLPAVDKAIEIGVADSERLGLIGHSFGGYSTYSLITFTDRFHAAISIAGISNLVSMYGVFQGRRRYGSYPHEYLYARWCEVGQSGMGATPWGNLWRYIRNSPFYYLDRVKTPLMIIQADLDAVRIQQGEEFFTGLYRLGKRAKFVRYWGESHTIESPANVRDMWERIFEWLDHYLKH